MIKNFVIILPRGATGGTELGHQFVDVINRHSSSAGYVLYYPFKAYGGVQPEFESYRCNTICVDDIYQLLNLRIIVPETFTYLRRRFKNYKVSIWWMSVDNYFGSKKIRYALGNRFLPWTFQRKFQEEHGVQFNFYQSEYARRFLIESGANNLLSVSDFLNPDFFTDNARSERKRVVLYNPAKGIEYTEQIIAAAPDVQFRPIVNMSRSDVFALLRASMIYIDFGNHPGKDRIPREAAVLGCQLIVGRRGSAVNPVDIPIPEAYKFDVGPSFSPSEVVNQIRFMLYNHSSIDGDFDAYRESIRAEKSRFVDEVCSAAKLL